MTDSVSINNGNDASNSSVSGVGTTSIAARKYKIGKMKQTPTVRVDSVSGLHYIDLKARPDEKVYGVTKFLNHYQVQMKLGQGTFGSVYRGVHLETQRQVAMKRILINVENDLFPITAQREITILKKLNHKNVIKLIEMVYDSPPDTTDEATVNTKFFYMILPYMVSDLSGVLHNPRITLEMSDIKNIMLQLLEGINYIHCSKYMHRDIKTANILIDHNGTVKLADFGLARLYYGSPPNLKYPGGAGAGAKYTSVVVTRWYRAPELVLGDKYYTTAVDIWGVGCVFAEFFEKRPILQGTSDIDQGHVIFKLMGTPTEENWKLSKYLPGAELTRTTYKGTLHERFGKYLTEKGLTFLSKLLALDPYKRYTAVSAMNDEFFKEEPLPSKQLLLLCEESHESDIKRYKEELHQAMSQREPTAPPGHMVDTPNNAKSQHIKNTTPLKVGSHKQPPAGPAIMMKPALNKSNSGEYQQRGYQQKGSRYTNNADGSNNSNQGKQLPQRPRSDINQQQYRYNNRDSGNTNNYYNSQDSNNQSSYNNTQSRYQYNNNIRAAQDIPSVNRPSRYQGSGSEQTNPHQNRNPIFSRIGVSESFVEGQEDDNNVTRVYKRSKKHDRDGNRNYDNDNNGDDNKDISNLY